VKKHFELVIVAIVVISVLPMVFEFWQARRAAKRGQSALLEATTIGDSPDSDEPEPPLGQPAAAVDVERRQAIP
jgi:hypothetical protein